MNTKYVRRRYLKVIGDGFLPGFVKRDAEKVNIFPTPNALA